MPTPELMRDSPKSPLLEIVPGLLVKFECHNPGGSHKFRAARSIVEQALDEGKIIPGKTTVIEKTGGNFGFGLTAACQQLSVPIELAIGLSFSRIKRDYLQFLGASLIGTEMLAAGATPRVVDHRLEGAAVGVRPPFVDWALVSAVRQVSFEDMVESQRSFARQHGHFVGNTAAACLHVGTRIAKTAGSSKILVLLYDHGLWYFSSK